MGLLATPTLEVISVKSTCIFNVLDAPLCDFHESCRISVIVVCWLVFCQANLGMSPVSLLSFPVASPRELLRAARHYEGAAQILISQAVKTAGQVFILHICLSVCFVRVLPIRIITTS